LEAGASTARHLIRRRVLFVNGVSVAVDETARQGSERQVLPPRHVPAREVRSIAAGNDPTSQYSSFNDVTDQFLGSLVARRLRLRGGGARLSIVRSNAPGMWTTANAARDAIRLPCRSSHRGLRRSVEGGVTHDCFPIRERRAPTLAVRGGLSAPRQSRPLVSHFDELGELAAQVRRRLESRNAGRKRSTARSRELA
jgi:hypothetical protein